MKTIEIRIPELGNAAGTTNFIAPKLEHIAATLQAGKTRDGEPCLTYEHWERKKDGAPARFILCYIPAANDDWENGRNWESRNGTKCVFPEIADQEIGLFPVLTPPAKKYVNDFLDKVTDDFFEKWSKEA